VCATIVGWIAQIILTLLGATRQATQAAIFTAGYGTRAAAFLARHGAAGACWGNTVLLADHASEFVLHHELLHVEQWQRYGWRMFVIPRELLELEVHQRLESSPSLSASWFSDSSML
jgi:hypothetical protein